MKSLPGQKSLFPKIMSAEFSEDNKYRYSLRRAWKRCDRFVNFIMLNPSIADEVNDDATIRRCLGYADAWGYNGIVVTNLFAYRATEPRWLKHVNDPVGPKNNRHLLVCAKTSDRVVCAWGNHGAWRDRDLEVINLIGSHVSLFYLDLTNSGQPKHPLRLSGGLFPRLWIPTPR